jgi:hypothetical protein
VALWGQPWQFPAKALHAEPHGTPRGSFDQVGDRVRHHHALEQSARAPCPKAAAQEAEPSSGQSGVVEQLPHGTGPLWAPGSGIHRSRDAEHGLAGKRFGGGRILLSSDCVYKEGAILVACHVSQERCRPSGPEASIAPASSAGRGWWEEGIFRDEGLVGLPRQSATRPQGHVCRDAGGTDGRVAERRLSDCDAKSPLACRGELAEPGRVSGVCCRLCSELRRV